MKTTRREMLQGLGGGLAAPLVLPTWAKGANDKLSFGMIGTGSRGRWLNSTFQNIGAQCVGLCDVYEIALEEARKGSPVGVAVYNDYDELLARDDLDFVVIATPDHQHRPCLEAALKAGKDVYLEKPLSLSLAESELMVAAANQTDRIVQIGMQRRSMPFIHRAKRLIDEGMIGRISMAKAKWNWNFVLPLDNSPLPGKVDWDRFLGTAPQRPFEPRRIRWWRGFWDYSGGNMTDQGTHLMDVVQWLTGSGTPRSAVCQGKTINAPHCEVPNVFSAVFEYENILATWTLDYQTSFEYDWSIQIIGDKGAMTLKDEGCRVYDEPGVSPNPWALKRLPGEIYFEADRDPGDAHMRNMLDCVKSRKKPNCPIETAAAAVCGPHMANIAFREDRKVKA